MRFSYVGGNPDDQDQDQDPRDGRVYYVVGPNALDNHRLHYCAQEDRPEPAPVIAIPPPPPVYDIGEIYRRNIEMYYAQDEDDDVIRNEERRQYDPERNIIHYLYNDEEDHHPVQG
jgi:hypothetical protein